ncbi:MAG: hypothetical protein IJE25_04460 [Clostridia bacterium]|nr:hypothetical protein [Clostridia bacterium]
MNELQLKMCDIQGRLFELSGAVGYDSVNFIKAFMTGEVAKGLDSKFNRLQWAGEEYLLAEIADNAELTKGGTVYDKEVLYWAGYLYRFWHFATGEDSKDIYRQAPAETMSRNWLIFHTLAPEVAIEDLKEIYRQRNESDKPQKAASKIDKAKKIKDAEDTIQKINELLADSGLFRRQADSLYDKISKNMDCAPFIATAKAASGMGGNIPFTQLPYQPKRNALVMIRDAIKVYVAKTIVD